MRYTVIVAAALSLLSCTDSPTLPPGAESFDPPDAYRDWHEAAVECSGLSGDYGRINWYVVPETTSFLEGRVGRWYPPHDIYLAETRISNRHVVAHEILHDLLQSPEHPRPPFGTCDTPEGYD